MSEEVLFHVGDEGVALVVVLYDQDGAARDCSTASVLKMKVWKAGTDEGEDPDITEDALATGDGSNEISYTFTTGQLSVAGTYRARVYVEDGAFKGHSTAVYFNVEEAD